MLPTTVLANPLPQPPDLGGPGPVLGKQMVACLPFAAVAPPELA